jgi:hypothetical protein
MDVARLILLAVACLMLILLVTALVRSAATKPDPRQLRVVADPQGAQWLSLDQVAARLETKPAELLRAAGAGRARLDPVLRRGPREPNGAGDLLVSARRDRRLGGRLSRAVSGSSGRWRALDRAP